MKNVIVLGIALFLAACQSTKSVNNVRSAKIMYVDFNVATFIPVSCEGFEKSFSEGDKHVEATDEDFTAQLSDKLKTLKTNSDEPTRNVRIKVLITQTSGKVDTLCISQNDMVYNGQGVAYDKALLDIIVQRVNHR